jgi:hypothetical protein
MSLNHAAQYLSRSLKTVKFSGEQADWSGWEQSVLSALDTVHLGSLILKPADTVVAALTEDLEKSFMASDEVKQEELGVPKVTAYFASANPQVFHWLNECLPKEVQTKARLLYKVKRGDCFGLWMALKTMYTSASRAEKSLAKVTFRKLKMNRNSIDIAGFMMTILTAVATMEATGAKPADEEQLEVLMEGVSPPFDTTRDRLYEDDDLTWAKADKALMRRSKRLAVTQRSEKLEQAHAATAEAVYYSHGESHGSSKEGMPQNHHLLGSSVSIVVATTINASARWLNVPSRDFRNIALTVTSLSVGRCLTLYRLVAPRLSLTRRLLQAENRRRRTRSLQK